MSWTKTDDNWSVKRQVEGLNFEEQGYLFALIQYCSRGDNFEGRIKRFTARTMGECSDVDSILGHLVEVGQAEWDGDYLVLTQVGEHLPSEEVRDRTAAEREKKRRQRAHAKGDHDLCSPNNCQTLRVPGTVPGTIEGQGDVEQPCPPDVPGTVGTGQDGPGLEEVPPSFVQLPRQAGQSSPPCGVDLTTGELDACAGCDEPLTWCRCPA